MQEPNMRATNQNHKNNNNTNNNNNNNNNNKNTRGDKRINKLRLRLDKQDMIRVLEDFPKFELSYEEVVHKKVHADCFSLIPCGKPCFAWFSIYNEHSACFIIDVQRNTVEIMTAGFNESLAIGDGTIVRGVLFHHSSARLFAIEDVHFYKGEPILNAKHSTAKFNILKSMLCNEIGAHAFTNNCVTFGLPIMHSNYDELINIVRTQTFYNVKYIQFGTIDKHGSCKMLMNYDEVFSKADGSEVTKVASVTSVTSVTKGSEVVKPDMKKTREFFVSPDEQPDIYHLVKDGVSYGMACIPNFKTSVMMNKLFRNLKENDNLDTLEESDEEEFENEDPHKFVHLERTIAMKCEYNTKFKKWVPICMA